MCVCVSKTARRLRSFRFSQERRGDSEGFFVYRPRSLSPSLYLVILWKWMSKNDQNLRQNEISLSKLIQLYTDFYSYLTFSNVSSFPICKKAFCFVNRIWRPKRKWLKNYVIFVIIWDTKFSWYWKAFTRTSDIIFINFYLRLCWNVFVV